VQCFFSFTAFVNTIENLATARLYKVS